MVDMCGMQARLPQVCTSSRLPSFLIDLNMMALSEERSIVPEACVTEQGLLLDQTWKDGSTGKAWNTDALVQLVQVWLLTEGTCKTVQIVLCRSAGQLCSAAVIA